MIEKISMFAAVALPLFNIPLIIKILQRKSSQDLSMVWLLGVWTCSLLMMPSAVKSPDMVWRIFSYTNITLLSIVVIVALKYRNGIQHKDS